MKSLIVFIALLCAVILSSSSQSSVSNAAAAARKERAEMKFEFPVQLMGVTLHGQYLFVHDDAAMMRGEACTSVYRGVDEVASKLVVSFHCTPINRSLSGYFRVRTSLNAQNQQQLREFQFAGSSEGHLVPPDLHDEHVAIVPVN